MTTLRTTWPAQIAVVLVLLVAGTASGASGFLKRNSPLGKNAAEASYCQAAASLSGESHRGCGDLKPQDAAGLFVAPRSIGRPPQGARVLQADPNGKWVIFEDAAGVKKIQFDVNAAENVAPKPLPPRGPGKVPTPETEAVVGPNGKVWVTEGMHRLEAAQGGAQIAVGEGGIPGLPGWLEYVLRK